MFPAFKMSASIGVSGMLIQPTIYRRQRCTGYRDGVYRLQKWGARDAYTTGTYTGNRESSLHIVHVSSTDIGMLY